MPIDSLRGRPSCDFDVRLPERKTCGGQCVQSAAANSHSDENAKIVTISGLGEVPASGKREISLRVSTTYTGSQTGRNLLQLKWRDKAPLQIFCGPCEATITQG
jgi:hypothetical protein